MAQSRGFFAGWRSTKGLGLILYVCTVCILYAVCIVCVVCPWTSISTSIASSFSLSIHLSNIQLHVGGQGGEHFLTRRQLSMFLKQSNLDGTGRDVSAKLQQPMYQLLLQRPHALPFSLPERSLLYICHAPICIFRVLLSLQVAVCARSCQFSFACGLKCPRT